MYILFVKDNSSVKEYEEIIYNYNNFFIKKKVFPYKYENVILHCIKL